MGSTKAAASPYHVKIVTSRAGLGHIQGGKAVEEALLRGYPGQVEVSTVDALKDHVPVPFSYLPELYPYQVERTARAYGWGYRFTDHPLPTKWILKILWPVVRRGMLRLYTENPPDALVCVHSIEGHYVTWAREHLGLSTPVVTVVTDAVSAHTVWFSPDADRVLVGSGEARDKALSLGLAPGRVRVIGLPVDPRFVDHLLPRADARAVLGWDGDRPAVLVVGGGDGVGGITKHARALDAACPGIQIAVVTARNHRLLKRLGRRTWRNPVHLYGFVDHATEMSLLMSAADVLVTKAGPGTLHDAYLAGLPVVLSGAVPYQEAGNVTQVLEGGAGVWAPDPRLAAQVVRSWLTGDGRDLERMAACARALARPLAAEITAQEIWRLLTGPEEATRPTHAMAEE